MVIEVVWLNRRQLGDITKLLLMRLIGLHITNVRAASLVVIIAKIVGDAGLRIS